MSFVATMSFVARLVPGHEAFNALNLRTVRVFFQKSPGMPDAGRGIERADYRVLVGRAEIARGRTGSDGKVEVRLRPGGAITLEILGSQYGVSLDESPFAAANMTEGRKERLRYLGYQIGHGGPHGNGVDDNPQVFEYERSVLDFQAECGLTLDADETTIDVELNRILQPPDDAGA